ncbi:hypothetical protein BDV97DRAFT_349437 [Delphinella strobiligena]|nr:hypothetical protein BDV97DRAFT_349437 [Delphinella strobiligena]
MISSVIAYDSIEKRCRVFRSYDNESVSQSATPPPRFRPLSPGLADICKVNQTIRAISAAPPYFEPVAIFGNKYMNASTILANPTRESINEVLNRTGNEPQALKFLVSIGCGQPNQESYSGFKQLWSNNALKAMTLDSQNAHEQTDTFSRLHDTPYFRFEVKGKTWKQSHSKSGDQSLYAQLEQEVHDYFDTKEANRLLEECAQDLVARRRLRTKDYNKWSKFTSDKL